MSKLVVSTYIPLDGVIEADVRPEHAALFRLLGGGVPCDLTGLPNTQLAILPGTTHLGVITRIDWLASMMIPFLDTPVSDTQ